VLASLGDDVHRAEAIRILWREAGWPERAMTAAHWLSLARMIEAPCLPPLTLPGAITARIDGDLIRLERPDTTSLAIEPEPEPEPSPVRLPIPGEAAWNGGRIVAIHARDEDGEESGEFNERIDLDALDLPDGPHLEVRAPRAGDRFAPLGLGGQTTPLADFLRSRRVPRVDRRLVPIVCDRTGIVWVVGHRIADRVRRTEATRRVLGLSWRRPGSASCD
jgi:tRNA(Ile)-lysidine synthase